MKTLLRDILPLALVGAFLPPVASAVERLAAIPAASIEVASARELLVTLSVRAEPATGRPITGTPMRAWLRLPTAADTTLAAYATHSAAEPLATARVAANASEAALDLTTYISGMGDFPLVVRAERDVFAPGATGPVLELTLDDGKQSAYYDRTPAEALARGRLYLARYSAPEDVAQFGYFDVTKPPYGAKGDGITDDTAAIQRAVTEARDARVVAYFPPGTYLVSDTIQMIQGTVDYGPVPAAEWEETWNVREFPCVLAGPATGPRAVIRLRDATFRNPSAPRPVLDFWSRHSPPRIAWDPEKNKANVNYNQTLRHLDIDLGAGNPGAMGVSMYSAQGSSIAEVTIRAHGAFAGLASGTGPGGGIHEVTVEGGRYGAYFEEGQNTLVTHSVFRDQEQAGVRFGGRGALTLVGVLLEGRGIELTNGRDPAPWNGNLTVVDSVLRLATPGPAITGRRNVFLSDVYFHRADPLVQLTHPDEAGTPGPRLTGDAAGWRHVGTWAAGVSMVQSPVWQKGPASVAPNWLDGTPSSEPYLSGASAEAPPAGFLDRHAWRPTPAWNAPGVVNARAAGAKGDGVTDDWPALQAALDAHLAVFLPRGDYVISRPLRLRADGAFFGLNASFSVLKPRLGAGSAFLDAKDPQPLVRTSADPGDTATTLLADLKLFQPATAAPGSYLLDWRAGSRSTFKYVHTDRRRQEGAGGARTTRVDFPLVRISDTGAGRWYGFWNDRAPGLAGNGTQLTVSGTRRPLRFYMLNLEHSEADTHADFIDVRGVDIFQTKAEGEVPILRFRGSRDFRVFSLGGASSPDPGGANLVLQDCRDFLVASMDYQQQAAATKADARRFFRLRDESAGAPPVATPGWEQFVLYQRGTPRPPP